MHLGEILSALFIKNVKYVIAKLAKLVCNPDWKQGRIRDKHKFDDKSW